MGADKSGDALRQRQFEQMTARRDAVQQGQKFGETRRAHRCARRSRRYVAAGVKHRFHQRRREGDDGGVGRIRPMPRGAEIGDRIRLDLQDYGALNAGALVRLVDDVEIDSARQDEQRARAEPFGDVPAPYLLRA